jgi:dephospho-CoA kinase
MNPDEVRARIAAQAPDAKRKRAADVIIHNGGTLDELRGSVGDVWELLERRAKL